MEPERGSIVLSEQELAEEEELWTDDAGWFCVRTDPFPCPAAGCSFVADFMTAAHLILVWQERDDPNLLWHAQRAKEVGRNPRVVAYEEPFGPSASYYAWRPLAAPSTESAGSRDRATLRRELAVLARSRGGGDDPRRR